MLKREFPLLSVIIPVYNVEEYLTECLESIVNQTYRNLEIIVINDGSTDNSISIIKQYEKKDNRIIVIDKINGGLSSARNAGLEAMTGSLVTFVDGDDVIQLDTFETNVNFFEEDQLLEVLQYPILSGWRGKEEHYIIHKTSIFYNCHEIYSAIWKNEVLSYSFCNKIFKAFIFTYYKFPEGRLYEDMYLSACIYSKLNKVMITEKGCYLYRFREGSIMNSEFSFEKSYSLLLSKLELYKNSLNNPMISKKEKIIFLLENIYWFMVHYFRNYSAEQKKDVLEVLKPYPVNFILVLKLLVDPQLSIKYKVHLFLLSVFGLNVTHIIFSFLERLKNAKENG